MPIKTSHKGLLSMGVVRELMGVPAVDLDVSEKVLRIFYDANYVAIDPQGNVLTSVCVPNTFFIPKEKQVS